MKIFTEDEGFWEHKVNFVDDNDVFVGYDLTQCCCERADWFISDSIPECLPKDLNQPKELEGYYFDVDFFEELDRLPHENHDWDALDMGGVAIFRLIKEGKEKYLNLFNCHNGYYGHGFKVEHNGEEIKSGYL